MRNLLIATALLAASCAEQTGPGVAPDEDEDPIVWPLPTDDLPPDLPTTSRALEEDPADPNLDVCALLPDDDGACAHACDPDALIAFIPEGTCVTFSCTLTNGRLYRTGGCNK
jgi:hypothetical protein